MSKFWITFIINEAIGVTQVFVLISGLNAPLKLALENFITAGQAVIAEL